MTYSAQFLGYIVSPSEKEKEFAHRVALINDINTIQLALKKGNISVEQFDYMWDQPIPVLSRIIMDQSFILSINV